MIPQIFDPPGPEDMVLEDPIDTPADMTVNTSDTLDELPPEDDETVVKMLDELEDKLDEIEMYVADMAVRFVSDVPLDPEEIRLSETGDSTRETLGAIPAVPNATPVVAAVDDLGDWHDPGSGRYAKPGWSTAKAMILKGLRALAGAAQQAGSVDAISKRSYPGLGVNRGDRVRLHWSDMNNALLHTVGSDGRTRSVFVDWDDFNAFTPTKQRSGVEMLTPDVTGLVTQDMGLRPSPNRLEGIGLSDTKRERLNDAQALFSAGREVRKWEEPTDDSSLSVMVGPDRFEVNPVTVPDGPDGWVLEHNGEQVDSVPVGPFGDVKNKLVMELENRARSVTATRLNSYKYTKRGAGGSLDVHTAEGDYLGFVQEAGPNKWENPRMGIGKGPLASVAAEMHKRWLAGNTPDAPVTQDRVVAPRDTVMDRIRSQVGLPPLPGPSTPNGYDRNMKPVPDAPVARSVRGREVMAEVDAMRARGERIPRLRDAADAMTGRQIADSVPDVPITQDMAGVPVVDRSNAWETTGPTGLDPVEGEEYFLVRNGRVTKGKYAGKTETGQLTLEGNKGYRSNVKAGDVQFFQNEDDAIEAAHRNAFADGANSDEYLFAPRKPQGAGGWYDYEIEVRSKNSPHLELTFDEVDEVGMVHSGDHKGTVRARSVAEALAQVADGGREWPTGWVRLHGETGPPEFVDYQAGTGKLRDLKTGRMLTVSVPMMPNEPRAVEWVAPTKESFKFGRRGKYDTTVDVTLSGRFLGWIRESPDGGWEDTRSDATGRTRYDVGVEMARRQFERQKPKLEQEARDRFDAAVAARDAALAHNASVLGGDVPERPITQNMAEPPVVQNMVATLAAWPAPNNKGQYPTVDTLTPDMVLWDTVPDPEMGAGHTMTATGVVAQHRGEGSGPFNEIRAQVYTDPDGYSSWFVDGANPEDWAGPIDGYADLVDGVDPDEWFGWEESGQARSLEQAKTDAFAAINRVVDQLTTKPVDTTHSVSLMAVAVADRNQRAPRRKSSTIDDWKRTGPVEMTGWDDRETPVVQNMVVRTPADKYVPGEYKGYQEWLGDRAKDRQQLFAEMPTSDLILIAAADNHDLQNGGTPSSGIPTSSNPNTGVEVMMSPRDAMADLAVERFLATAELRSRGQVPDAEGFDRWGWPNGAGVVVVNPSKVDVPETPVTQDLSSAPNRSTPSSPVSLTTKIDTLTPDFTPEQRESAARLLTTLTGMPQSAGDKYLPMNVQRFVQGYSTREWVDPVFTDATPNPDAVALVQLWRRTLIDHVESKGGDGATLHRGVVDRGTDPFMPLRTPHWSDEYNDVNPGNSESGITSWTSVKSQAKGFGGHAVSQAIPVDQLMGRFGSINGEVLVADDPLVGVALDAWPNDVDGVPAAPFNTFPDRYRAAQPEAAVRGPRPDAVVEPPTVDRPTDLSLPTLRQLSESASPETVTPAATVVDMEVKPLNRLGKYTPDFKSNVPTEVLNAPIEHGAVVVRGTMAQPVFDAKSIMDAVERTQADARNRVDNRGFWDADSLMRSRKGTATTRVVVLDAKSAKRWKAQVEGIQTDIAAFKSQRAEIVAARKAERAARKNRLPDGNDQIPMPPSERARIAVDQVAWVVAKDNYLSRVGVKAGQAVQVKYVDGKTGEISVLDGSTIRPQTVKWERFTDTAPGDAVKVETPEGSGNTAVAAKAKAAAGTAGRVRETGATGAPVEVADSYLKRYGINPGDVIVVNWLDDKNAVFNHDGRQIKAGWARFTSRVPERDGDGWSVIDPDEGIPDTAPPAPDTPEKGVAGTIVEQIGAMTVAAISGGKRTPITKDGETVGIRMPAGAGYRVDVILDRGSDTYTVNRVLTRGNTEVVKGTVPGVYADQVSDVAYAASNWRTAFGLPAYPTSEAGLKDLVVNGDLSGREYEAVTRGAAMFTANGWAPGADVGQFTRNGVTVRRVRQDTNGRMVWEATDTRGAGDPYVTDTATKRAGTPDEIIDFVDYMTEQLSVTPVDSTKLVDDQTLAAFIADPDVEISGTPYMFDSKTYGVIARTPDGRVNRVIGKTRTPAEARGILKDVQRRVSTLATSDSGADAIDTATRKQATFRNPVEVKASAVKPGDWVDMVDGETDFPDGGVLVTKVDTAGLTTISTTGSSFVVSPDTPVGVLRATPTPPQVEAPVTQGFRPSHLVSLAPHHFKMDAPKKQSMIDEAASIIAGGVWPGPGPAPSRAELAAMTPSELRRIVASLNRWLASHPYGDESGVDLFQPLVASIDTPTTHNGAS